MEKKYIYHCFGGTHSSVLSAALHLGIVDARRCPGYRELLEIPYFDQVTAKEAGIINYMGSDAEGNHIYMLGCRNCGSLVEKIVKQTNSLCGIDNSIMKMIDTTSCLNILIITGGFISRRLGFTYLGRALLYLGIRIAFPKFTKLVQTVKDG